MLVVRRGEHEPVVVEGEVVHIFRLADCADKADGDLAGFKHPVHLLAVAAAQRVAELRLALQKRGEVARHQILPRHGGRAERDHGGREEGPAHGGGRDDDLLRAQLDEIEEGLDQRRPHPALEPGFDAAVASFEEQAQRQREQAAGEDDKVENAHKQV